jgi:hypothetical protein
MAIGDVYESRVVCSTSSQISVNVYHHQVVDESPAPASLLAIATAFDSRVAVLYKSMMTDQATYRGVGTRRVRPFPPSTEVAFTGSQGTGGNLQDPLPKQVSGLITFRTAFGGRAFRGRKYIPFPAESSSGPAAQPLPLYVSGLQAIGDACLPLMLVQDGANFTNLQFVVFHRSGGTGTPIILAVGRPQWATQRRRGDFGRPNDAPF